ncbi:MAG: response regulator [Desulfomonilaceae bacterium]
MMREHVSVSPSEDETVFEAVQDEKPVPTGNQRILLVDDEEMLTELGQSILGGLGYDVVTTTSPIQALDIFRAEPDGFDLVITDLTMPKITGDQFAREILAIRPEIPIIGCTGFSLTISEEDAKAAGIRILITKPILRKDIAETVRHLLDEKTEKER